MKNEEHVVSVEELSNDLVEIVKVPMDDKGGVLFIGSLSADDFVEWTSMRDFASPEGKRNSGATLIVRSLVRGEKDATRVGTDDMIAKFRKVKVSKSERLLKAIFKLNGINQKDEVVAKNE